MIDLYVASVMHDHGCCAVWPVDRRCIYNAVSEANGIVRSVGSPEWIIIPPRDRSPWTIPSGIVAPAPWRHPKSVRWSVDILYRGPCPHVHNSARGCGACIYSYFFCGLNDGFNTIDVRVANYLQNCFSIASFFQFDNCNVLAFIGGNYRLENECVHVAFVLIDNTNVVDVAVAIEVEVIHFRIGRVEKLFKLLR